MPRIADASRSSRSRQSGSSAGVHSGGSPALPASPRVAHTREMVVSGCCAYLQIVTPDVNVSSSGWANTNRICFCSITTPPSVSVLLCRLLSHTPDDLTCARVYGRVISFRFGHANRTALHMMRLFTGNDAGLAATGGTPVTPFRRQMGIFIFSSLIQACILNDGFTDNYFEVNM